jgi:hypothetical protein
MAAAGHDGTALLRAIALGAVVLAVRPPALAQTPAAHPRDPVEREIVISAPREADKALTAKVEKVLGEDPYLYVGHIEVVTERGIVRLQGVATDMSDIVRAMVLARRVAGTRHVRNEIELVTDVECHD